MCENNELDDENPKKKGKKLDFMVSEEDHIIIKKEAFKRGLSIRMLILQALKEFIDSK